MLAACECAGRVRDAFAARGWEAWSCDILPPVENQPELATGTDCGKKYRKKLRHGVPDRYGHVVVKGSSHWQGDVRDLFDSHHPVNFERTQEWCKAYADSWNLWDLVIAFPPCTDLTLGGARWFKDKDARRGGDGRMQRGAAFFMDMVNAPAPRVAVENPLGVMCRRPEYERDGDNAVGYRWPDQVVEPWWFGEPYAKRTGLWLKNLPRLVADKPVAPVGRVATGGGSWRTDKTQERVAMSRYEDSRGRENRAYMRSLTFEGFARAMADQWGAHVEEQEDFAQWRRERGA